MKKIIFAAAMALGVFASPSASACDKGCTMGGNFLGILPQYQKNFAGIRYNTRSYTLTAVHSHMMNGVPMEHREVTEEQYDNVELWGRFYPTNRIQAFVFVPYVMNTQKTADATLEQKGLGDISILANYTFVNTADSASGKVKQTLLLGGGVKLPTGTYNAKQDGELLPTNLQTGSGSVDFLLNAMYTVRHKQIGLTSDFTYRFNTEGKNDYRFGNRYNGSANLFYWQNAGAIALLPSAGVYYENARPDVYHDDHKRQGGGDALFGSAGLSVYYKNLTVGATYLKPVGHSHGEHITESNSRASLSFAVMF